VTEQNVDFSENQISLEQTGENIIGAEGPSENNTDDYKPLFDDEVRPTEAELMGEEPEAESETDTQEKSDEPQETKKEEDESATSQPEEEEDKSDGDEEKEEPKDTKPPDGYVPFAALKEERSKRQDQGREIAELKSQINDLLEMVSKPQARAEESGDEFKMLSEKEFEELLDDDPVKAIEYQRREFRYLREQESKERENRTLAERERHDERLVDGAFERLHKNIPDLFEENSDVGERLSTFASEYGFAPEHLSALGDPRTLILTPGAEEPVPLGERAAALIEFIHGVNKTVSENTPEKLRASVESELRKSITDEVTKELTKKLKSNPTDFKSIGDTPTQPENPDEHGRDYTEAEWARLPKEKREALLYGA